MSEAQHTETPLKPTYNGFGIIGEKGKVLFRIPLGSTLTEEECLALVAFTVRAINSHDALLGACKAAAEVLNPRESWSSELACGAYKKIQTALALAEIEEAT